jgi:radical SAM protein with 4Fe4S-binding SPASM domain
MRYDLSKILKYFENGISYVFELEKVIGSPAHVHIETTNICNFKCVYCPQSMPDEHFKIIGRGKMEFVVYQSIIDKLLNSFRIERIVLTRDGEPLVHPELEEFIAYNTHKGVKTTIGSNGSLITIDRAKRLIQNGLSILKGDFCFDKEKYENLRVGARYEKSLNGYRNMLMSAKEQKSDFKLVLVDLNTYDLTDPLAIDESMQQLRSLFDEFDQWLSIGVAVMHNALGESQETLSTSFKKFKGKKTKYNLCHHPWLEMVIDYRGNVVACCRDLRSEYQLGNILEVGDVKNEIWNGEKMRYLRRQLKHKQPEKVDICHKCDLPYGISYAGNSIPKKILRFLKT